MNIFEIRILVILFIYGFIIWNHYSAKLSSYLSTPNLGKQLKTSEEVNQANITLWSDFYRERQIKTSDFVKEFYPNVFEYEQNPFRGKFNYGISSSKFNERIFKFDTN